MIKKDIAQFPIVYFGSTAGGRVALGWGAHTTVGNECKAAGIKKALVVTTGLKGTGIVDEIIGILHHHGIYTELFDKVTSNPKDHEVMAGYKVFKEAKCDGVVSVGGGSSHDCSKAIRAVAANDGIEVTKLRREPGTEPAAEFKPCQIPQVSVNTTSGTGAENSSGAVVTDTKLRIKGGVGVPGIAPRIAIDDPLLTRLQPQNIAAQTGFDAFAHAYELYLSRINSEFSLGLAYHVIKLVAENLREFAYNRGNHVACEKMTWAASLAGAIGLGSGSGLSIAHTLGHGLSAVCDTHHGLATAVLTIPVGRYNQSACPDRFAEMAEAMGVDTRGMTKMQAADKWFEEVERLLKDLGIQTGNLNKQFGLKKEDCPHIVENHIGARGRHSNPRDYNYEEYVQLMESLL